MQSLCRAAVTNWFSRMKRIMQKVRFKLAPSIFEGDIYHTNNDSGSMVFPAEDVAALRRNYPELSGWSDRTIVRAFSEFSSDVLEVAWAEWLLDRRDDLFLCYCCWRQKLPHEHKNQRGQS